MTYPVPDETPCESMAYSTITLTLPNCEEYWWILINQIYELTESEIYDSAGNVNDVTQVFQNMIDLAIYADAP